MGSIHIFASINLKVDQKEQTEQIAKELVARQEATGSHFGAQIYALDGPLDGLFATVLTGCTIEPTVTFDIEQECEQKLFELAKIGLGMDDV